MPKTVDGDFGRPFCLRKGATPHLLSRWGYGARSSVSCKILAVADSVRDSIPRRTNPRPDPPMETWRPAP
jgi:hypothetical protein